MKQITAIAFVFGAVFASACGNKVDDAISKLNGFSDRICACKDLQCASEVQKEQKELGDKLKSEMSSAKPTEEQTKKLMEAGMRGAECASKLVK